MDICSLVTMWVFVLNDVHDACRSSASSLGCLGPATKPSLLFFWVNVTLFLPFLGYPEGKMVSLFPWSA